MKITMSTRTSKSHVETAEEALREALVLALKEKCDTQLSQLFEALNNVKSILNSYPATSNTENNFSQYPDLNFDTYPEITNVAYYNQGGMASTSSPDVLSFG